MKNELPKIDSQDGQFHNGDPNTGEKGTRVTAVWLNDVQDRLRDFAAECRYVLSQAGMQPLATKTTQLYEAIVQIIVDNRRSASTQNKGEVQLTSDTGLDSEVLGLTAKAGKKLAQQIAENKLNADRSFIQNSKKSSAVNSTSEDTVATSKAVKAAYDKGVEAKTAADNALDVANGKWTKQRASDTQEGITILSHKTDGTDKTKAASEFALGEVGKKSLPLGSVVAFPQAITHPAGFLLADGSTFNQATFPDLYQALGNSNRLPNLQRSDVGLVAWFAVENIPEGWIAFDEIKDRVTEQNYPELHRTLVEKYGAIDQVPKVADRFIRNAGENLQLGQLQNESVKNHIHGVGINSVGNDNVYFEQGAFNGELQRPRYLPGSGEDGRIHQAVNVNLASPLDAVTYKGAKFNGMITTIQNERDGETRPKTLVLKLCIKAVNQFDEVKFWIKAYGEVTHLGELDAGHLAQSLQDKADREHLHTASQITDFDEKIDEWMRARIVRLNHSKTIKGTSTWDSGTSKNITVTGYTIVYPDGKIEQYFHYKAFRVPWFDMEDVIANNERAYQIPVGLWTAMPNKITHATAQFSRPTANNYTAYGEALEWSMPLWNLQKQGSDKSNCYFTVRRWTGSENEPIDMYIKVEGY